MCDVSCIAGKQAPGVEKGPVTGSSDLSVLNVLSVGSEWDGVGGGVGYCAYASDFCSVVCSW